MPSGPRIRTNNVQGTITDNPLTSSATTLNSAGLANLDVVSSAHAILVLDPLRAAGAPEIVVVTAHTASATSATITRGAYGTTARQHAAGTLWVHAATVDDVIRITTSAARPSDPYEGQLIYETDNDKYVGHTGTTWIDVVALGAWQSYTPSNTNITVGNGTQIARFTRIGRTIHWTWSLSWGSTTTFGGTVEVGLPVAVSGSLAIGTSVGYGETRDSGVRSFPLTAILDVVGGSQAILIHPETGNTGLVNATVPYTFVENDRLSISGTYEAAA